MRPLFLAISLLLPQNLWAYTANKVWFDFMRNGSYRVSVSYTIPALREFREAYAVFKKKKEAQTFYWHLVRGGEFSVNGPSSLRFEPTKLAPDPW
jgi:hypothetical protein